MRAIALGAALLMVVAAPVYAGECPARIAAFDEQFGVHGSMLSSDQQAKIKQMRDKAEQAHKDGKHEEAIETIQQAQQSMGM